MATRALPLQATDDRQSGLGIAHATLLRATRFLGNGLRSAEERAVPGIEGKYRLKVIGNSLRELDGFLNALIDQALRPAGPAIVTDLAGVRNTANKLSVARTHIGRPNPEFERLRALGRSRDCLFYCAGIVRRADERDGTTFTAGWPPSASSENAPPLILNVGDELSVNAIDIKRVSEFYCSLASRFLSEVAQDLDLSRRH
jgi:hypothetical protein